MMSSNVSLPTDGDPDEAQTAAAPVSVPGDAAQHLEPYRRRHERQQIGRDRERALLHARFDEALAGSGSIVLIAGDPGIGKTLLLDTVAQQAESVGATVLRGGMSEDEGMPPYLPFLEALGQYISEAPIEALRQQLGYRAAILSGILPEISHRLPPISEPPALPAEQAHLRMFEAVIQFLRAIAVETPLVLTLDDLHWADRSSLAMLSYIARHLGHSRILLLGAFREDQSALNPHLERMISDLHRGRLLTTIHLGPLSEDDVAVLAEARLQGAVDEKLRRGLFDNSEGNPFFAEELIYRWIEIESITNDRGTWKIKAGQDDAIPHGIISALRQRLVRTSPELVELLRMASIIGRTFELRTLASLAQSDPEEVENQLALASRLHLVESEDMDVFTFCHAMIRRCLYSEVSSTRRRRLHTEIGAILEPISNVADPYSIAALAFHFSRSDDREKGIMYSLRAAAMARTAYAPSDAAGHCQMALQLLGHDDERRGNLLLQLADAQLLAGELDEAFHTYESALVWWRNAGHRANTARAIRGCAAVRRRTGALDAAEALLHEGLAGLANERGTERIRLLVELATLVGIQIGRLEDGLAYAQEAWAAVENEAEIDASVVARVGCARGSLLVYLNRLDEGISGLTESLAVAGAAQDLAEETRTCSSLTQALFWNARIQDAEGVSWRRQRSAQRSHDAFVRCHAYACLSLLHAVQGKWSRAERLAELSLSSLREIASTRPVPPVNLLRGFIAFQRRDYAAATLYLQLAMRRNESREPTQRARALGMLGVSAVYLGAIEHADVFIADLEALLTQLPADSIATGVVVAALTTIGLALGGDDQIDRHYSKLLKFEGQFHFELVDHILARTEIRRREFAAASRHLQAAESTARREGLRPQLAFVLETQAVLLHETDGSTGVGNVRRSLSQALGLFRELNLDGDAQRIERRLASLATTGQSQPALPRIDSALGLSPRELEILQLVAKGLTNREIASRLFLSEKTVANHMTSIFNKTGTNNRASATAFALQNSLVGTVRLDNARG